MEFRDIRNVKKIPEDPPAYICDLDLFENGKWSHAEYCARPGGGGICDAVIAAIEAGQYEGEITPWQPGG